MTESERIDRLTAVLEGTGATVNDAFGIWAFESQLADVHIAELAGWADLQFLVAGSSLITDSSVDAICGFRRLTDLDIGGTAITGSTLANSDLPPSLQSLGVALIQLGDLAVEPILRCPEITELNVNYCDLPTDALFRLAKLPRLRVMEAVGADTTPKSSKLLSQEHPGTLFRLSDGVWQAGVCRRPSFPSERA